MLFFSPVVFWSVFRELVGHPVREVVLVLLVPLVLVVLMATLDPLALL